MNHDHLCVIMHIKYMILIILCRSPLQFYNALNDAFTILCCNNIHFQISLLVMLSLVGLHVGFVKFVGH